MPIYEYRCKQCRGKVAILIRESSGGPVCPHCGGAELDRVFSTFRVGKKDMAVYEDILNDSRLVKGLMNNDPRALAEWNKKMSQGSDYPIAPEYEDMLGRMEAGQPPAPPPEAPPETKAGAKKSKE